MAVLQTQNQEPITRKTVKSRNNECYKRVSSRILNRVEWKGKDPLPTLWGTTSKRKEEVSRSELHKNRMLKRRSAWVPETDT